MAGATTPYLRPEAGGRHLWIVAALGLVAFGAGAGMSLALGELQAFYIALSAVAALGVLADFRFGAVLLILMLPVADSQFFPRSLLDITGLNPFNLLLAATLASFVMHGGTRGAGRFLPRPLLWLYLVPIAAAGLIGVARVDDIALAFYEAEAVTFVGAAGYLRDMVLKPLFIVLAALLVGAAAARASRPERFIVPIALSVWPIVLVQIGIVALSGTSLGRLAGTGAREFFSVTGFHANDLGRIHALAYALLVFVWWETKRPGLKLFLLITMLAMGFALLLTFSRAAFLGAFLVSGLFVLWKFNARTLALALGGGALFLALAPGYVFWRLSHGFGPGDTLDDVSAGRIDGIWTPLLPEFWDSPLWGQGIASIMWSDAVHLGFMHAVIHPHNAYLEAALDMGLLGLALLLAFYWHVWRGFRALGSNAYLSPELRGFFQGAAAALICFLVTGMAGSSLRPDSELVYLWLAIGMMYGVLARRPAA